MQMETACRAPTASSPLGLRTAMNGDGACSEGPEDLLRERGAAHAVSSKDAVHIGPQIGRGNKAE